MKLCNGYLIGCLFRDFSKTAFRGVLFSRCQKAKEAFKIKVKSRLINEFSQQDATERTLRRRSCGTN